MAKKQINQLKARVILEVSLRGWTLAQFANKIGRSPQALNDLLKRNNPRLDTLDAMAEALDMDMEDFTLPVTEKAFGEATIPRVE